MGKLPIIVIRMIEAIFDTQLPDLTSGNNKSALENFAFQMQLCSLKDRLLSHVKLMNNSIILITQSNKDGEIFTLKFKTSDLDLINEQYAKTIQFIIKPMWDGFDIYELYKSSKKHYHEFKL